MRTSVALAVLALGLLVVPGAFGTRSYTDPADDSGAAPDITTIAVSHDDAGVPGKGPWFLYAGPVPFTGYKVSDRPSGADQMCILVANSDHSVVDGTGNCVELP